MSKPILIIGDCCLDIFVYCHCERLCPEAPVPVLDITNQTENPGMAGNVYRNILALKADVKFICNDNYEKISKTRFVETKTNHMFIRVDSKALISRFNGIKDIDWNKYSAIVISDYNKGFLTEEDIEYISQHHPLTFLDTKKVLGKWANKITFIKINRKEFLNTEQTLTPILKSKVIQTLGSDGCSYNNKTYPVKNVEIKNLSGAGDSFLAGLVVEYLKNKDIEKALIFANKVASIVVQKMGVSTV
jgi:D-beta-D-heptose 7-phosphate kinase/D-beta-D-heptose 1-phosphate adenosyltransferase